MRKNSKFPDRFSLSYEDKQYFASILKKQIATLDTDTIALQAVCNALIFLDPTTPEPVCKNIINYFLLIAEELSEPADQINNYRAVLKDEIESYSQPLKIYAVGYTLQDCYFPEIYPAEKCHTIETRYVRTYPAKGSNIPVATTPEDILNIHEEKHKTFIMNNATYRFV